MAQLKKDQLSKLYREFSRQRYTKYKHQFPRMRESELVSKIIKEWEALNDQEKNKLYKQYQEREGLPDDKSDSSNQRPDGKTTEVASKKTPISKLREKSRTPVKQSGSGVKVYRGDRSEQKPRSQSSDFARPQEGNVELSQSDSKQIIGVSKIKKIKKSSKSPKTNKTQYLKFFDFYYAKLHSEHPRWRPNQISTIIKLLWKKKTLTGKPKKSDLKSPRDYKPISGIFAFRKNFGYGGALGKVRWLQLTKQTRRYWRQRGQGKKSGQRRILATTLRLRNSLKRKASQDVSSRNSINSFINKPISLLTAE